VSKSRTLITFSLLSKVPRVNCNGARVVPSWLRFWKMASNYMVAKNSRSYRFSHIRLLKKLSFLLAKTTSSLTMEQLLMLRMRIISSSGICLKSRNWESLRHSSRIFGEVLSGTLMANLLEELMTIKSQFMSFLLWLWFQISKEIPTP